MPCVHRFIAGCAKKKLVEAARRWAGGREVNDVGSDLEAFGIKTEGLEAITEDTEFEVWPENAVAVEMFLRCSTQWRMGFGGAVGLDYPAIIEVLRLYEVADVKKVFEDVQTMERAALETMHQASK